MGVLKKIREENVKYEKRTPHNFCDRWCEICPQETRDRCAVYEEGLDKSLKHMSKGEDPNSWEAVRKDMEESFQKSIGLLKKMAEEQGIDIEAEKDPAGEEEERARQEKVKAHPLSKLAVEYLTAVSGFLKESSDEDEGDVLTDSFEVLIWYHTLLPPKVYRLLDGLFSSDEEGNVRLCDAVAQLDIVKTGLFRSGEALKNIAEEESMRKSALRLASMVHKMSGMIELLERDIDERVFGEPEES